MVYAKSIEITQTVDVVIEEVDALERQNQLEHKRNVNLLRYEMLRTFPSHQGRQQCSVIPFTFLVLTSRH